MMDADSSYPEVAAWYKTHVDAFSDKTSSSCPADPSSSGDPSGPGIPLK